MSRRPPYWPYQCKKCSRYVSNPVVTHSVEEIVAERGDCSRCGPGVDLWPLCWEDWFGEDYDPYAAILADIAAGKEVPA